MESIKSTGYAEKIKRELLKNYHLTESSLKYIDNYCQHRLTDLWNKDISRYHFWISSPNEEENRSIALSIYTLFHQILPESSGFNAKEQELLDNPEQLLQKGKHAFVLITDCRQEPLTKEEADKWTHLQKVLTNPNCPTCFLLISMETFNLKFQDEKNTRLREMLFYQTFMYRLEIKTNYTAEDYQNELNCWLDELSKRTEAFDLAMSDYLNAVLSKTHTNEGLAFFEDLKKRVFETYINIGQPDVLDERCVPSYKKEELPSETPKSTAQKPPAPQKMLPPLPMPDLGNFFEFDPDSEPVMDRKNVLLLTLSVSNRFTRSTVSLTNEPGEALFPYYYQLEPVPCKLMKQFHMAGDKEKLDGIIMICSPQTTSTNRESIDEMSPQFKDSFKNYFIYKTSEFAQKLHQEIPADVQPGNAEPAINPDYLLSYQEITTTVGNRDAKSLAPENRSVDIKELVYKVIEQIRILNKHYPNLQIHVDTHGGLRTTQEILNSVLSLLQMEGIFIDPNNIHTVELLDPDKEKNTKPEEEQATTFLTTGRDVFAIMNFVSGIHECINYGQVISLNNSMEENSSPDEKKILKFMQTIAEGIQLCDVKKFENGLTSLAKSLEKLKEMPVNIRSAGYLTLFQNLIRDSYGSKLLDNKHRSTIDEIYWCLDKGFIQQALTLLESKMPAEIIQQKFLVSDSDAKHPALFTSDGTAIKPDVRDNLKENGIPENDISPLENTVVQQAGYKRSRRKGNNYVFISLNDLPDAKKILNNLPKISLPHSKNSSKNSKNGKHSNTTDLNMYEVTLRGSVRILNESTGKKVKQNREASFYIQENPAAVHEINVFIRLHMQLKQERNATNHAGEDEERSSIAVIQNALKCYIVLYNAIIKKLHS